MASKLATFRTDSDTWENFQAKAKANKTNASALLQGFLRDYLDNSIDSNLDKAAINYGIDESLDSRIDAVLESKVYACIDERIDNKLESILQRVVSLESAAIATVTSEATAPAKKPTESDNQESEVLPIIEAIEATDTAAPDTVATDKATAPAKTKSITYQIAKDGSIVLRSLRGTDSRTLKKMNDSELKAIGLFKTLIGKDEKFFPI